MILKNNEETSLTCWKSYIFWSKNSFFTIYCDFSVAKQPDIFFNKKKLNTFELLKKMLKFLKKKDLFFCRPVLSSIWG